MALEDVQRDRRHQSVAQRVLLIEESGMGAGLLVIPRTPFVDEERDALLRVVLVHDRRVTRDVLVDSRGRLQRGSPLVLAESGGGSLVFPVARRYRIVMQ